MDKYSPKGKIASTSVTRHISGTVYRMIMIFGTLVWNDDISRLFFHFFEIFIFHAVRGVKGQKLAQNVKKLCLVHFISQELYIIWSSFVVHKCKVITSPGVFFFFFLFFKNFFVLCCYEGQRAKMNQNDKKTLYVAHYISRTIHRILMVHMCKRIISPGVFLHFSTS